MHQLGATQQSLFVRAAVDELLQLSTSLVQRRDELVNDQIERLSSHFVHEKLDSSARLKTLFDRGCLLRYRIRCHRFSLLEAGRDLLLAENPGSGRDIR